MRTAVRLALRANGSAHPACSSSSSTPAFTNASLFRSQLGRLTQSPGQSMRTLSTTGNVSRGDFGEGNRQTIRKEGESSGSNGPTTVGTGAKNDTSDAKPRTFKRDHGNNAKLQKGGRADDPKGALNELGKNSDAVASNADAPVAYASNRNKEKVGKPSKSNTQREELKRWDGASETYGQGSRTRDTSTPAAPSVDKVSYSSKRTSTPTQTPKRNWDKRNNNIDNKDVSNNTKEESTGVQFARRAQKVPYKPEPVQPTFVSRRPPVVVDEFVAPPEEGAPVVFQSHRLDPSEKKKMKKAKKNKNPGNDVEKAAAAGEPPKPKLVSYRIQPKKFSELDILLGRQFSSPHSMSVSPEVQHKKAMAGKEKKVVKPVEFVKVDQVDLPLTISLADLAAMSHIPIETLFFTMGKVHSSRLAEIGEEQDLPGCVLAYTAGQGPIQKRALKELGNALNKPKFQSNDNVQKVARRAALMLTVNRELAANIMFEHDILSEYLPESTMDDEILTVIDRDDPEYLNYPSRPPVVTIMGHVDHGKTTLLDTLRNANVAAGESGGITQAVGAFNVFLKSSDGEESERVVFVDTPGHAAFAKMRKNGAAVTDIIVLIVAATDGLQPQTRESIELAKAANIPLVVALTKIDMPGINQETAMYSVCADLQLEGVLTETVGGTVPVIPISAPQGIGLDDLTEALILQAEMMELHAPTKHRGEAVVLESFFDSKQGQMIDAIVRCGTLKPGDEIIVADQSGRIRALLDPVTGKQLQRALPSAPVRIVGLKDAVPSGSTVIAISDPKRLNKVLEGRKRVAKMDRLLTDHKVIRRHRLEAREKARIATAAREAAMEAGVKHSDYEKQILFDAASSGEGKRQPLVVPIVLKADTDGSLAALRYSIEGLSGGLCATEEDEAAYEAAIADGDALLAPPLLLPPGSHLKLSRMGVGPITPQDIDMAETLGCHVYGFNVRANHMVTSKAAESGVVLNTKSVIYHLLDDLKKDLLGQMGNVMETTVKGSASVLKVFSMNGKQHGSDWKVAGCKVEQGSISFSSKIRVVRDGKVIHTASGVDSLKIFKEDVKNVDEGDECGISLTGFQEFKEGDQLQSYDENETEFAEAVNRKK